MEGTQPVSKDFVSSPASAGGTDRSGTETRGIQPLEGQGRAAGPTFGFTKPEFAAWLDGTFSPRAEGSVQQAGSAVGVMLGPG
jgi:hypothetical protein